MKTIKYNADLSIIEESNAHGLRFTLTDGEKKKAFFFTAYRRDGSDDFVAGTYPVVVTKAKSFAKDIAINWYSVRGDAA